MKFGKNIGRVVELSDPEWSPFWVNYKFLKKKAKVRVSAFLAFPLLRNTWYHIGRKRDVWLLLSFFVVCSIYKKVEVKLQPNGARMYLLFPLLYRMIGCISRFHPMHARRTTAAVRVRTAYM